MRTLLNPRWLWLLNTLPILVLLALLGAEYRVIRTQLPPESRLLWQWFGAALVGLASLHAAYAAWLTRRRARLTSAYALAALGLYIAFLYAYGHSLGQLLPFSLPRWLVAGDLPFYAGTFLMPTLAHAAAVLVLRLTPDDRPHRALPSFGVALAVPVGWYGFAQVVLPLWRGYHRLSGHVLVVVLIAGTLVFLLALARGVYIVAARRAGHWARYQWVWKLLIAGVLPLLGLAVNNGLLFKGDSLWRDGGLFGDFTGPWWYGLAALNAVLLLLPAPARPSGRLALYLGRGVLLAYTLYFFLVFLPFLPLSVVAVVAAGVGFLLLTPLALFVVHVRELAHDYAALRPFFGGRKLALGLTAAVAVLPLIVTLHYSRHHAALHQALDYVYTPNYTRPATLPDTVALHQTLAVVRQHKENRSASITGAHLPYLSAYFNWLVLDNLTLSEDKIGTLAQVFFNQAPRRFTASPVAAVATSTTNLAIRSPEAGPTLTGLAARSYYDAAQHAWVSWVDLTVTNADTIGQFGEYTTTFELPAGCFVSNYYLDMQGRREPGILAEKRAAAWVYSQIRNENRDPGLLHYLSGNRLALRVFPFGPREVRRTGIQLLHRDPLTFTLDGRAVQLGQPLKPGASRPAAVEGVAYVSAAEKAALPVTRRQPYLHFIVDMSAGKEAQWKSYRRRMSALLQQHGANNQHTQYSLTGAEVITLNSLGMLEQHAAAYRFAGGFYLDRAIRQTLVRAAEQPQARYPVFVVVSADFDQAILPADFADLRHALPDTDEFYELTENGRLVPHSLWQHSAARQAPVARPAAASPVVAWPTAERPVAYLPASHQPDVVLTAAQPSAAETTIQRRSWRAGLLLHGLWRAQLHHPETTEAAGLRLVQHSFRAGILTPLTAYLALENDAQKAALRRKQVQLLAGHAALDAGEDEQRMSEPGDWVLLVLAAGLLGWHWRQRCRTVAADA
ncbi:MSEP-CTERM sorting domain-containing protein [Hymenobacter weizhouensis]|uniref:MSEP-CTERM sorting domain-containing protein n=1 Tax=Hymenobacter sp. YIM 151500-1 TaxID=2987689 RepID=UPI002226AFD2|nr:MSEP-CTERM sorting domain-containing protein [Hymenobacter sp. YIM 151500-1]UYZ64791.1 MSEP-CTERM sorting domain-containing protein [Hymenobacter sp. YIM 151500-1]